MLLLHLSDIHFKKSEIITALDPNYNLRQKLLDDAEERCRTLGKPDVLIVSGDIAFAGEVEEYQFAQKWLSELCQKCRCDLSTVFVIPGNHDVSRSIVERPVIQALHREIKSSTPLTQEAIVRSFLTDDETKKLLYEGIQNYNTFAQQFFCDLLAPNRTRAFRELYLNDGSRLKLWGVNSCFVSSAADKQGDLFVDSSALQITREAGVENLVMVHHPYAWLRNGDALEDHLNDVARIQLFGHVHTNRVRMDRDWMRFAASAAHPDRSETGWEPGYNLIKLEVVETGGSRKLKIDGHIRVWQTSPGMFRAKLDRNQQDVFRHEISLEPWAPSPGAKVLGRHATQFEEAGKGTADPGSMTTLRDASIGFYRLKFSQKLEIAGRLGLLEEQDMREPDYERFRRVFLRAHERGQLELLVKAIESATKSES